MREEGEIRDLEKPHQQDENSGLSHTFLAELIETQEELPKVISNVLGEKKGLDSGLLGSEESNIVSAELGLIT